MGNVVRQGRSFAVRPLCSLICAILALALRGGASARPASGALDGLSFDVPKAAPAEVCPVPGVKAVWIDGEPYGGKPTKFFAYYGIPEGASAAHPVPGIVLIHGGWCTAYASWVQTWVKRGYAAIAADNCGAIPKRVAGTQHDWAASGFGGPRGWGRTDLADLPPREQWPYHAVATVIRSHSFLRSLPEVDADRTGVTGVSWGGFLTLLAAGVDSRFKFAAPVYASAAYEGTNCRLSCTDDRLWKAWHRLWDPRLFVRQMKMPVVWSAATADFYFPFDDLQKGFASLPSEPQLAIRVGMKHGHGPAGENVPEIFQMADRVLKGAPEAPRVKSFSVSDGRISAAFDLKGRKARGYDLCWTASDGDWRKRKWEVRRTPSAAPVFSSALPAGARAAFVNLVLDEPTGESVYPESVVSTKAWFRPAQEPAVMVVSPDRMNCRYEVGETAVLKVTAEGTNGVRLARGVLSVKLDNFGASEVQTREVDLAKENPFVVRVCRKTPGFARLGITSKGLAVRANAGLPAGTYCYGVAFSPTRIVSGTPEPKDFDAFWAEAIRKLDETVPVDAKMELVPEKSKGLCNYYRVSFATHGGRRVYGWLSEPKDLARGPFPVRVSVPGAGIGALGTGGDGQTISMTMNVHSYAQPEDKGPYDGGERRRLYDAQDAKFAKPNGVKRYCQAGIHRSREDYFYYASILGINRAVNWLAARPECDLRRFTYSGTSQGGGFGLYLTALNRNITRSCIFVPALTDLLGYRVEGRQSGWPQLIEEQAPENRSQAERWAPYFCGVNFARRITCPVRFVAGFGDTVCSPNAVYSAFNACPSADKRIFDGIGMGHQVFGDFYDYLSAWERETPGFKPQYRFVAFNIWGDYFGNPPHERDVQEAAIIRKWNPDFFGMQEVTKGFWKSRLFSDLSDAYEVIGRGMGPGGIDAFCSVGYRRSRFDLVDRGAVWYCPELDRSKGAVWAVLRDKATGEKLLVFASHYWWRADGVADDWVRLDNSHRLLATMKEVSRKYDAAIVGGGDLNSPIESWAMKYLLDNGLADAQQSATVSCRTCPSFHSGPVRDANGAYVGIPAIRGFGRGYLYLDHVFYDPTRIVADRFDLDMSAEACNVSDHHPLCVDFRMK